MFTGIIRDIGRIVALEAQNGGLKAQISTVLPVENWALGASIACAGACLTVIAREKGQFAVEISPETLRVTTMGQWKTGDFVNLEPSLKMGDPLDGHLVSGHVDGVGRISTLAEAGNSWLLGVEMPEPLLPFMAPKGTVALDGISLTINQVKGAVVELMIIPHTYAHTTLQYRKPGDALHIEVDMMARYASRLLTKN